MKVTMYVNLSDDTRLDPERPYLYAQSERVSPSAGNSTYSFDIDLPDWHFIKDTVIHATTPRKETP